MLSGLIAMFVNLLPIVIGMRIIVTCFFTFLAFEVFISFFSRLISVIGQLLRLLLLVLFLSTSPLLGLFSTRCFLCPFPRFAMISALSSVVEIDVGIVFHILVIRFICI